MKVYVDCECGDEFEVEIVSESAPDGTHLFVEDFIQHCDCDISQMEIEAKALEGYDDTLSSHLEDIALSGMDY